MKTIGLRAEREAQESVIECEAGALENRLPALLSAYDQAMLFTDRNVYALYGEELKRILPQTPVFVMEAGEAHKRAETLLALLQAMAEAGLHRSSVLVALGGGVAGDVGGLASALYMRGIDCIQVPTTLLAQVDSSVGGKTAVDFGEVKNLIGAFHQPKHVLVDGNFLATLPARELRCGLGEMIKHGALCPALFQPLVENRENLFDLDFLRAAVPEHIAFKAGVVMRDPQERGERKSLNLGHTTGHALELSHGRLSHGEYVLLGLLLEAEIARACVPDHDGAFLDELQELALAVLGCVPSLPPEEELIASARLDKKNRTRGRVALALPSRCGRYVTAELKEEEYLSLIRRARRKFQC